MNLAKICFASLLMATIATTASAQDNIDAYRFSGVFPTGTARSLGIGSSMGAIGGDFTSLSTNPAGIGVYRRSELVITPSLTLGNTETDYLGTSSSRNSSRFQLNNVGYVKTWASSGKDYRNSAWKVISFGLGVNRTADFTRDYRYGGVNPHSSFSYIFEEYNANFNTGDAAQGDPGSLAFLGFQTYLTNQDTLFNRPGYFSPIDPKLDKINQTFIAKERGGISEVVVSLGGNFEEKLMLGATLGINALKYERTKTVTETLDPSSTIDFQNLTFNETLKTTGTGINLKLGAIYKFTNSFRVGLALHTPTYYTLTDVSDVNLTTATQSNGIKRTDGDTREYNYNLLTPLRAIVSAGAVLGKFGFFNVDYEVVPYQSMRYTFEDFPTFEDQSNQNIKDAFKTAQNVRAGLEIKLEQLMLRGGMGYYGSPYQDASKKAERLLVSGGLGYRFGPTSLDLAVVNTSFKSAEVPYTLNQDVYGNIPVNLANLKNSNTRVALTFGVKF